MFNHYYNRPETAVKNKRILCAAVAVFAFFVLIGTGTEDLTTFIIKNSVCITVMAIAAIIGKLNSIRR